VDERTRLGLGLLGVALILGALGDALLRATPWGVNVLLWVAALAGASAGLARWGGIRVAGEGRWLLPVAVLFAGGVALRDSPTVASLDVLAVLISLALAALWGRSGGLRRLGLSEYAFGGIYAGVLSVAGPLPVSVADIRWREVARGSWRKQTLAVTRGLFIAAPLLLLFGSLLVAADATFENLVLEIFGFDVVEVLGHLFLIGFFTWTTSGLLWAAVMARNPERLALPRPATLSLGVVELGVVLGLLDTLFLSFVVVQIPYLFGGAAQVAASAGLTYSEYARSGFFELVAVTALALPVLLLAHWLLRAEGRTQVRIFRALTGTLVALLFVVMASALQRMYLYTQEFGLTELRLYTTIFMLWIATVLVWSLLTVLRDRRDRFAFGALVSGFAAILLINAINPDALIARVNISRMEEGKRFDAYYLTYLSADAAPVLVKALPSMSEKDRHIVEADLRARRTSADGDWRTWNLGRARARSLVDAYIGADGRSRDAGAVAGRRS
jgi:hypothetical protein